MKITTKYPVNTIIHQFQYDTIYEFDLTDNVSFGPLPQEVIYSLFKDGRVASKFVENALPYWFPELIYVDEDGYDHVHNTTTRKFDLKGFTKGGASYAPSNMIGAGRKIDEVKMHTHANTIDYIFSDITNFPKIRIIFKSGVKMVLDYPNGKIPFSSKDILFKILLEADDNSQITE